MHEGWASKWKGAALSAYELSVAVDSGMGSTANISKHCLN